MKNHSAPPLRSRLANLTLLSILLSAASAQAGVWLPPDDRALRSDVQLLADAGVLAIPMTTWPLSWLDVQEGLESAATHQDAAVQAALSRVRRRAEAALEGLGFHSRLSLQDGSPVLRAFGNRPREEAEIAVGAEWVGERFSGDLQVAAVSDPRDDETVRWDGSYAVFQLGNWWLGADKVSRWWGPGWEGSLILGNNARPVPGVTLQRVRSTPFETEWLSWLGPWQFVAFVGELEEERHVPNAKLFGARLVFRPLDSLELGLSRAAQWGGEGRPEDFDTFWRMVVGDDNSWTAEARAEEPGNQLAGYDLRWRLPGLPGAFYAQAIGDDESNGLPTAKMMLYGLEGWGSSAWGRHRLHLEYADTANRRGWTLSATGFNYTYNHGVYRDGYRYYDQSLGHSMDNDGRLVTLGALLVTPERGSWEALLGSGTLNRDGGGLNLVSATDKNLQFVEILHSHPFGRVTVDLGVWWQQLEERSTSEKERDTGAFLNLTTRY